ncbi:MAG TPA: SpoIIE family protein phosphatase, partial [Bacteroidia bacterium]|nr:SpoIIE family protein phosphatase [Bacteroidia bacterium]
SGILLIVFAFAVFAYRSYLQKQKANSELDKRNSEIGKAYNIIAEKNHEITDSINYAQRIQSAMLPSVASIKKTFPQSFILFKPKDIVSGDFYFFHKNGDKVFLAAADCTGHGVPGAFMSMIGSEKLNDAVQQSKDTAEVLEKLNKGIKASLHQSSDTDSTRDGMDIALIAVSLKPAANSFKVQFSGANRPLWIIRKGANIMEEVKSTKKAIGGFTEGDVVFEKNETEINKDDTFYLFSDGYADQFGGKEGKKITKKKFRELLLSIQHLPIPDQQNKLEEFISEWQGNREQLDDILVIGVKG